MTQFQYIDIEASTPYDVGVAYGSQAREKIIAGVADYKQLFAEKHRDSWDQTVAYALDFVPVIEARMPQTLEEAKGIAVGAGVSLGEIMVLNTRYEITKFPKDQECTSFAALPGATADGHMLAGQNWDYRAGILPNIVVVRIRRPDGFRLIGIAEAGQLVRHGMNSHGLCLTTNNLQSIHDTRGVGIPTCFIRRRVLDCAAFEEARALLETYPRAVSCNYLLAAADGRAADIEAYPGGADVLEPTENILTHANHFVAQPELHALKCSPRDTRLWELLARHNGSLGWEEISWALCDHENAPQALCRHPANPKIRLGLRDMTVASEIYDLTEGTARICAGPPCQGEYVTYQL